MNSPSRGSISESISWPKSGYCLKNYFVDCSSISLLEHYELLANTIGVCESNNSDYYSVSSVQPNIPCLPQLNART